MRRANRQDGSLNSIAAVLIVLNCSGDPTLGVTLSKAL